MAAGCSARWHKEEPDGVGQTASDDPQCLIEYAATLACVHAPTTQWGHTICKAVYQGEGSNAKGECVGFLG